MNFWKLVILISTFLVFTSLCLAQTETGTPDPEKEQANKEENERVVQMLDQVIGDASLLRVPQNKAVVYALAADLYWKFDEKKSRDHLLDRFSAADVHTLAKLVAAQDMIRGGYPTYSHRWFSHAPPLHLLPQLFIPE